jgi:ectoine hydroxylase-related dioxygenase (phytanoyl-CoA dioxygenase family)
MLTPTQVEFYRKYGYLAVENVLTPAQLDEARRVVDDFVERSRAVTAHDEVFDLEPDHTPERPHVRRLKNPVKIHPVFDGLMRSDPILDHIAPLIGEAIRYQGSKLNMKAAEGGSPVEWHQDYAFYPHTNDDLLAVGVALDDCTLENGCLLVLPGSHKGPILDHHQDGVFVGAISPSRERVDLSQAVPVEVRAGGVSIHHVRLLHGSAPNRSARPRRLLLYQYAAVDAWPLSGVPDLDAFNRDILRGQPTVEARMITLTARIPRPQPARTGSIFEIQTQLKEAVFAGR